MTIGVRNKYDVLTSVSTRTHRSKYVVLVSVSTRTHNHQVRHFFSPIPQKHNHLEIKHLQNINFHEREQTSIPTITI